MLKSILLLLYLAFVINTYSQTDMIVLKKNNRTIQRYFTGTFISFQFQNKQWINGYIQKLKPDSLYIVPIQEKPVLNFLGMVVTDTIILNTIKIPLHKIYAMPKKKESFAYIKNGTLLQILSGSYILLNVINTTTSSKEPVFGNDNIKRLGIATGVLGIGTLLRAVYKSYYPIGKKYQLQIIQLAPSS